MFSYTCLEYNVKITQHTYNKNSNVHYMWILEAFTVTCGRVSIKPFHVFMSLSKNSWTLPKSLNTCFQELATLAAGVGRCLRKPRMLDHFSSIHKKLRGSILILKSSKLDQKLLCICIFSHSPPLCIICPLYVFKSQYLKLSFQ